MNEYSEHVCVYLRKLFIVQQKRNKIRLTDLEILDHFGLKCLYHSLDRLHPFLLEMFNIIILLSTNIALGFGPTFIMDKS